MDMVIIDRFEEESLDTFTPEEDARAFKPGYYSAEDLNNVSKYSLLLEGKASEELTAVDVEYLSTMTMDDKYTVVSGVITAAYRIDELDEDGCPIWSQLRVDDEYIITASVESLMSIEAFKNPALELVQQRANGYIKNLL